MMHRVDLNQKNLSFEDRFDCIAKNALSPLRYLLNGREITLYRGHLVSNQSARKNSNWKRTAFAVFLATVFTWIGILAALIYQISRKCCGKKHKWSYFNDPRCLENPPCCLPKFLISLFPQIWLGVSNKSTLTQEELEINENKRYLNDQHFLNKSKRRLERTSKVQTRSPQQFTLDFPSVEVENNSIGEIEASWKFNKCNESPLRIAVNINEFNIGDTLFSTITLTEGHDILFNKENDQNNTLWKKIITSVNEDLENQLISSHSTEPYVIANALLQTFINLDLKLAPEFLNMGASLLFIVKVDKRLYIANSGLLSAYLVNSKESIPLTEDQSLTNSRFNRGFQKREKKIKRGRRNSKPIIWIKTSRGIGYDTKPNNKEFKKFSARPKIVSVDLKEFDPDVKICLFSEKFADRKSLDQMTQQICNQCNLSNKEYVLQLMRLSQVNQQKNRINLESDTNSRNFKNHMTLERTKSISPLKSEIVSNYMKIATSKIDRDKGVLVASFNSKIEFKDI